LTGCAIDAILLSRRRADDAPQHEKGGETMRFSLLVLPSLLTAALLMGGDGAPSATYTNHEKVMAAFAKGGTLATASDYIVLALHRSGSTSIMWPTAKPPS
jgi:hypothetical protein